MGIEFEHPAYVYYKESMIDCRNAFEGSRAIKSAGPRYLPQLSGQTLADYNNYKNRALFFSITRKTTDALVGMVMMRAPQLKVEGEMEEYFTENQGAQFMEIASTTVQEVLLMAGYGFLLDAKPTGGDIEIARYARESIINWKVDDNGLPIMVVLREEDYRQKGADEYELELFTRYRKLFIGADGFYHVQLFDDKGNGGEVITPSADGRPMTAIPFYLINPLGVSMAVHRPPMLDIVDLNLSHYRTSADLEHGRHFTGLPTPYVTGVEAGTTLHIGSSVAWTLPDTDSAVGYLEFTGQGLQSLEKALVEKQSQMASMSARMIDNSRRGSEAEGTVKLRYMSETAALVTVVRAVEEGLNIVYGAIAKLKGATAPVIQMNKEFMDPKMSAADLTAFVKAYLEGGISKETLIYNLRKGDVISSTRTDEEEMAKILAPGQLKKEEAAASKPTQPQNVAST